MNKYKI